MRSFRVSQPPQCFVDLANTKPAEEWFDGEVEYERDCRHETRKTLLANQGDLCGWCEQKIAVSSSHIEHIKPKGNSQYKHLSRDISNLIACCGKTNSPTCGHHKGEKVISHWGHPYENHDLENYFCYEEDGKMIHRAHLSTSQQEEADEAINAILNLNHEVLKSKREEFLSDLADYDNHSESELFTIFGEFPSLIKQYLAS